MTQVSDCTLQNGMLCNSVGNFCVQAVNGEEGLQDGKCCLKINCSWDLEEQETAVL